MNETFTLNQFNRLSNAQKYALIEDHGVYLEVARLEAGQKVCLFSMFDNRFYVEVFYDQKKDRLLKASAFSSYKKLDLYLSEINIQALYHLL
jgi:16S rRNA U1498 N3-methylase RsmE